MAQEGVVKLLDVMTLVRQEADFVSSNFVTEPELVSYISNSYKALYNLLVGAYGENYYVAPKALFTTNSNQDEYPLPDGVLQFTDPNGTPFTAPPFYKLLGVDYQLSPNNPQGYVTLKTFPFAERNRFAVPNFASFWGFTNLRYCLQGNRLLLTPLPATGQTLQLRYIPRPINLINTVNGGLTYQSTTVTVTDDQTPQIGMNVFGSGIAPGTTITAVGTGNFTISLPALQTLALVPIQMFDYNTPIDGIAGWEEYIVIDAAIKCKDKEESDITVLAGRRAELKKEIEGIAANRDAGTAARTADVMTDIWSAGNGDGWGGWGSGG